IWRGGHVAREAKELCLSASSFSQGGSKQILYSKILAQAVRCPDPYVKVSGKWIVRRLAPDCSRVELRSLPTDQDKARLLGAMGAETANIHLGSVQARTLEKDLAARRKRWLHEAAAHMANSIWADWKEWRTEMARR